MKRTLGNQLVSVGMFAANFSLDSFSILPHCARSSFGVSATIIAIHYVFPPLFFSFISFERVDLLVTETRARIKKLFPPIGGVGQRAVIGVSLDSTAIGTNT